jgi:hypothetical protein
LIDGKKVISSRIFATLALLAAALVYGITHLWVSLDEFEGTIEFGGFLLLGYVFCPDSPASCCRF